MKYIGSHPVLADAVEIVCKQREVRLKLGAEIVTMVWTGCKYIIENHKQK